MFSGPQGQGMWPNEMMGEGMQLGGPLDGGLMNAMDGGMMGAMDGGLMNPVPGGIMHPMNGPAGPAMPMMGMGLMAHADGGRGRGPNARGPSGGWGQRPSRRNNMCFPFQRTGTCPVGAFCKYAHGAEWVGSSTDQPMTGPAPPSMSAPQPFSMGSMHAPQPPVRTDASMGSMMPRPPMPSAAVPAAARQQEVEVVDPADVAAVSYMDRVKATLALAGIGNADLKKHTPAAGAAAVYAIRSGEAFQASPYADAVLQYLPR